MDQITQIKQSLDIATIVGSYVALKKSGKNYKGVCPFHSEKSPSFMVSSELQMYRCFGCGESGDIIKFIEKIEGLFFPDALQNLADKAGIKLEKQKMDPDASLKKDLYWINEQAAKFYNYVLLNHSSGKVGLEYVKNKRKLSENTIKEFLIGYAPDSWDTLYKFFLSKKVESELLLKAGLVTKSEKGNITDKFRGRIVFPLTGIDGKVLGFTGRTIFDNTPKYLNTAETLVFHKSFFIFGLDKAKLEIKKSGAYLVEGQMDVITAHEHGLTNVVATSGTSLTESQLKLLSRYTNSLTFCFDSDVAGVNAMFRGIELAEKMGFDIKIAVIPGEFKDLDELVKSSVDKAKDMFNSAVPAYDFLLFSIIKKYNKNSPDGKKKIVDEIVPWFSKISNNVLFDHYSKEIARELDLDVETVISALKTKPDVAMWRSHSKDPEPTGKVSQQSLESYIITLFLKGGLDFMRSNLYKIEPVDFSDEKIKELLVQLQTTIKDTATPKSKKPSAFEAGKFKDSLKDELHQVFEDLYLIEIDPEISQDREHLKKELETTLSRLKAVSAKRRMQDISKMLRLAEKSNDTTAVKQLTDEFESLKNLLVTE